MALHNYIYSKHPRDAEADNRIARKHDNRPVIIRKYKTESANSNENGDSVEMEIRERVVVSANGENELVNAEPLGVMGMVDEFALKVPEMVESVDDPWNSDMDIEETESSDEPHNGKRRNHEKHYVNHHNHHNHKSHDQKEQSKVIAENTPVETPVKHKNPLEIDNDPQYKWVVVNGRRRKLKSRFAKQ